MSLLSLLPEVRGEYRENANIAKTTWFGVGGQAEVLFRPKDVDDLANFRGKISSDIKVSILGVGSNLLIRDGGIKGVVIKLGKSFVEMIYSNKIIEVGAGALNYNLANYCKDLSLSGLEFLVGIPGSVGGSIAMNAGAYGSDISSQLLKVEAIDRDGNITILRNEDVGFVYRGNTLDEGWIFTKAWFKISEGNKEEIENRMQEIHSARENSQPIRSKTSGSTFKNPTGYKAWELIDRSGCRGLKIGDAIVSEKHCNFLINLGNATASDIEDLGEEVRRRVLNQTGIDLMWEIIRIGDKF